MDESMFDRKVVYAALVHAVQTNAGIGFHNADQGHPVYLTGAKGQKPFPMMVADRPEVCAIFQMLVALGNEFGACKGVRIRTWQEFCQLATRAFDEEWEARSTRP